MKTHEINLKIQDESELYLTLDPYQNMLSQEIVDYLTRVTLNMHGKSNDKYIINVISDTPIDEQLIIFAPATLTEYGTSTTQRNGCR